jgi:uncharacterized metal-binding protein
MAGEELLMCAFCGMRACAAAPESKAKPPFCPVPRQEAELMNAEKRYFSDDHIHRIAVESARTEAAGYCRQTRVEEIIEFARRIGARKIGIAHCVGLMNEARLASEIFSSRGFEVHTVCCKVGSIDKESVGLRDSEKVRPGQYEALCNPIGQAALLAHVGTDLNVLVGLCVGHDSLFFMHSKAPATVLVVKDRVLGHNPVAALYTSHSYYKKLREQNSGE